MVRSKFAVSIASAVCAAGIGASLAAGLNRWQHEASQGIAFDRTLHDFGKVGEGTYDCEFELSNDSQYPARVKEVRASCGCIAYQIGDPIVPPGGRTQVSLTINAHGLHPPTTLRKSVTVTVDADGREIVFQLGVAADVRPDVVVKPSSLDFAAGEDERTFLVKREMLDADAFTSAAVKSTAACMEISAVDVHPNSLARSWEE